MHTLIPITRTEIDKTTVPTVNARHLHQFLEVHKDFSTWIKQRIEKYGFEEGKDYLHLIPPNGGIKKHGGDRRSIDYHLSVDMAKELSMVERNAKGKQARQYFIECERIAQTMRIEAPKLIATDNPAGLMAAIRAETNPAVQSLLYEQLQWLCRQQKLHLPPLLGDIVPGGELIGARLFARAIVKITRARAEINHSRTPYLRAYNYPRIVKLAKEFNCPLPKKAELMQSLKHSGYFLGEKIIDSKFRRGGVLCWVFRRDRNEGKHHGR